MTQALFLLHICSVMAGLPMSTVESMLEFLMEMQDWAAKVGFEDYIQSYHHNVHRVQFHNDFHTRFPLAGRGNWTATSCMSLFLPTFFDSEGFSAVRYESSGAFVEGFIYHLSNVDPPTATAFRYLLHAKHELDQTLRVTNPLAWERLTSRMSIGTYIVHFLQPIPAEGSPEFEAVLDRCRNV